MLSALFSTSVANEGKLTFEAPMLAREINEAKRANTSNRLTGSDRFTG